ncbi:MAG: FeoA domain-containing protein [Desulfobacteraceae bacterium]
MEDIISRDRQWKVRWRGFRNGPASMMKKPATGMGNFSLRLAKAGEWVRIVSVNGGKGVHERLAGFGLRVSAEVQVLHNSMNGKLILGHQGARLYLGGGMAHKIQVVVIQGGSR